LYLIKLSLSLSCITRDDVFFVSTIKIKNMELTPFSKTAPTNGLVASQQTVNAIILEDEPNNMELLINMLGEHCAHVNIIGTGVSVADGVKLISNAEVKVDVVFLDIKLEDGLAFDMFKYLQNVTFDVIFVTAWDQYFQQACDYYSIGYILKPIDPQDLIKAVKKVRTYADPRAIQNHNTSITELLNQIKNPHLAGKFPIPTSKGYSFVELDDIIRLEGLDNYTKIYTKKETLITARTIKVFDKILEPLNFYRVHKQHIINLRNMKQYLRTDSYVEMIDGMSIQVARRRKPAFLKILKKSPFI